MNERDLKQLKDEFNAMGFVLLTEEESNQYKEIIKENIILRKEIGNLREQLQKEN